MHLFRHELSMLQKNDLQEAAANKAADAARTYYVTQHIMFNNNTHSRWWWLLHGDYGVVLQADLQVCA